MPQARQDDGQDRRVSGERTGQQAARPGGPVEQDASPACRNVYLTLGSGPPRRYCSRRCATRERVAAYRRARG